MHTAPKPSAGLHDRTTAYQLQRQKNLRWR
jgi:hypothetical protein